MTASARTLLAGVAAALLALSQTAAGEPPPDAATVDAAYDIKAASGGYVLQDPGCGCPAPRPAMGTAEHPNKDYPTRCLAGNEVVPGTPYMPKDHSGSGYPRFTYPAGFPYEYDFGPKFMWLTGSVTAGSVIPFPGWPAVKNVVSTWSSTGRSNYLNKYADEGGDPPGKVKQLHTVVDTSGEGWEQWQIHHILERKHNATDDHRNLVPAYSYPRSWAGTNTEHQNLNQHSRYTKYWQRIKVDSDFKKGSATGIWKKIKDCAVVKWP